MKRLLIGLIAGMLALSGVSASAGWRHGPPPSVTHHSRAGVAVHVRQAHALQLPDPSNAAKLSFADDYLGGVPLRTTPCGWNTYTTFGVNTGSNIAAIEPWGAALTVLQIVAADSGCFSYPGANNINYDLVTDSTGRRGYVAIADL